MPWISLSIETDAAHAGELGDVLMELGALSADMHDAAAGSENEQPLFGEPGEAPERIWQITEVTALFNADADIKVILEATANALQLPALPASRCAVVEDQNWVKLTQSQFDPIRISSRLWIVPSWHEAPDPLAINLVLDPGMAFGTGSHPTTSLCLSWLDEVIRGGERVLDYGCGSGILAIAALKLGAAHATGIDIDHQAIAASRNNAVQNQIDEMSITFYTTPTDQSAALQADITIANILASPLIVLAPLLANMNLKGARIALSGILAEQAEEVRQVYQSWFFMDGMKEQEGWVLLTGTRR